MIKYTVYLSAIVLICFFASCKSAIKPEDLYGKWKYIKIEMPTAPEDTILVQSYLVNPTWIQFSKDSAVEIITPSLVTFHGSFTTDKYNIYVSGRYNDGSATKLQL